MKVAFAPQPPSLLKDVFCVFVEHPNTGISELWIFLLRSPFGRPTPVIQGALTFYRRTPSAMYSYDAQAEDADEDN